jgi:hypothetical protein
VLDVRRKQPEVEGLVVVNTVINFLEIKVTEVVKASELVAMVAAVHFV